MKIALIGSTGMIGQSILSSAWASAHDWLCVARRETTQPKASPFSIPLSLQSIRVDLNEPQTAEFWQAQLKGVDVVINSVGIIRENSGQKFSALHHHSPETIFRAAKEVGVRYIIQVSALGTEQPAEDLYSEYHRTKRAADDVLRALDIPHTVLYPSMILSPQGQSTQLFLSLASLPVTFCPAVKSKLQPVAVADLMASIETLLQHIEQQRPCPTQLVIAGDQAVTMQELLMLFKSALGLPSFIIAFPVFFSQCVAALGEVFSFIPLNREMLTMLQRGNSTEDTSMRTWLNRPATPLSSAIETVSHPNGVAVSCISASYLRWGLVFIWCWTAFVSLFNYDEGVRLIAALNLPQAFSPSVVPVAILGGAFLDLIIGIGIALNKRAALWASLVVMLVYSVIVTFAMPAWWLDPLGAMSKNVPIALMAWVLLLQNRKKTKE